jgi:hypothetical protein
LETLYAFDEISSYPSSSKEMPLSESASEEEWAGPGPLVVEEDKPDCEPTLELEEDELDKLEPPPEPEEDELEELPEGPEEGELEELEPPKLEEELEKRS